MANRLDTDQMSHSAVRDLGLYCLPRPVCPNTSGYYYTLFVCPNIKGNMKTPKSFNCEKYTLCVIISKEKIYAEPDISP